TFTSQPSSFYLHTRLVATLSLPLLPYTHLSRPRHHADQPAVLSAPRASSGGCFGASAEQPKPGPPDRGGHANGARPGRPLGALHHHDAGVSLLERRDQL